MDKVLTHEHKSKTPETRNTRNCMIVTVLSFEVTVAQQVRIVHFDSFIIPEMLD